MSPEAVTGERVYRDLKIGLLRGGDAPGSVINVHALAEELDLSISPVRDALHRLIGEGLVAVRPGGGFEIPRTNAETAQQLYAWHGSLMLSALDGADGTEGPIDFEPLIDTAAEDDAFALAELTAKLFLQLGATARNRFHVEEIKRTGERLFALRIREGRLLRPRSELSNLARLSRSGRGTALRRAIHTYHRRRLVKATALVELLYSPLPA